MSDRRRGVPELSSTVRVYYNLGGLAIEGRVVGIFETPSFTVERPDGTRRTMSSELEHEVLLAVPDEVLQAAHLAAFPGIPEGVSPQEARNRSDAAARVAWSAALSAVREAGRD